MVKRKVSLCISLAHTYPEKKQEKKTLLIADDSRCQKAVSFLREMSYSPKKSSVRLPVTSMRPSSTQTTLVASLHG